MKLNFLSLEFHRWSSITRKTTLFIFVLFAGSFMAKASDAAATTTDDGTQSPWVFYAVSAIGLIGVIALAWFLTTHDFSEKPTAHKRSKMAHKPRR